MQTIQYLTVTNDYSGQRLDNFLMSRLKGLPKSHLYRIIRKGELRINKKRVKPDYRLQEGDIIRSSATCPPCNKKYFKCKICCTT